MPTHYFLFNDPVSESSEDELEERDPMCTLTCVQSTSWLVDPLLQTEEIERNPVSFGQQRARMNHANNSEWFPWPDKAVNFLLILTVVTNLFCICKGLHPWSLSTEWLHKSDFWYQSGRPPFRILSHISVSIWIFINWIDSGCATCLCSSSFWPLNLSPPLSIYHLLIWNFLTSPLTHCTRVIISP